MNEVYEKKGYLLEDFRLFHLKETQGTNVDYHYHEFCKVLFLISGSGAYSVEGKRYELKAGDIVLVGNQCVHRPEFEEGISYERIILYISPEFLKKQSTEDGDLKECFWGENGPVFRPEERIKSRLIEQVRLLEEVLAEELYGREILSNSILLRILVEIVRAFRYGKGQRQTPMEPKSDTIRRLVEYMELHLTDELTIDELSEKIHLSRFHMMRKFKEEMGIPIHAHISNQRLFAAREMILQGELATEACFRSGFQSYAAFARAYGKFFGETPTGRKNRECVKEETFE